MSDRVLFIDVETTGLDPDRCDLLQVACVPVAAGVVLDKAIFNEYLAWPEYRVDPGVGKYPALLNNVGAAARNGRNPHDVRRDFVDYLVRELGWADGDKVEPGGKNFWKLDFPFLRQLWTRTGGDPGVLLQWFSHRAWDVGLLYATPGRPIPSLSEVIRTTPELDPSGFTAHDARDDALLSARLYALWYGKNK